MKIRIIGCSGSGKTYFAKRLSEKYNVPNFDLDDIQWDNSQNSYGMKMPVEKRNHMLHDILQQPDWIIGFLTAEKEPVSAEAHRLRTLPKDCGGSLQNPFLADVKRQESQSGFHNG